MMRGLLLVPALLITACDDVGMSTAEIREAAVERARKDFQLPANAKLDAKVWVGTEIDDSPAVCGTVSGDGAAMPPQRFLARTEPFDWIIFENAHAEMTLTQPNKFAEWQTYCSGQRT